MGFFHDEKCIQCGEVFSVPDYTILSRIGNFSVYICYRCRKENERNEEKAEKSLESTPRTQLNNQLSLFEDMEATR